MTRDRLAVRLRGSACIEGLGDPAPEAAIGNRTLRQQQQAVFEQAGFQIRDVTDLREVGDESVVFVDNLYLSPALLRQFLRAARARAAQEHGWFRLAIAENAFTAVTQFAGEQPAMTSDAGWPGKARQGQRAFLFGLYYRKPGSNTGDPSGLERAKPIVLTPWIRTIRIPFSSQIPSMTDATVPITDLAAIEITSWVHVWMANLCEIAVVFGAWLRSPVHWLWMAPRVLWGVVAALDVRPFQVMVSVLRRLSVRGRGCRVHPTATIEAWILGKGVEVGPFCSVRGSLIGNNVRIFEHSSVDGCVVGDGALINSQALLKVSLVYPEAVVQFMQAGVVGRRASLTRFARFLDLKLQGTVKVKHRGGLVDTGLPFLGACIGHRAVVAGDTILPPGWMLPNDYKVVSDPARQLTRVPEGLPADWLLVERGGTLEKLQPVRHGVSETPPASAPPDEIRSREE